jgi:hypothetical protein
VLEIDGFVGFLALALWVYCFIDVLLTPDGQQRNLPKLAWVFIVLLFPPIGPIAWLVAGKNYGKTATAARSTSGPASRYPEYDRPGRHVPGNPDDDEVFLASLRLRAEEQRRRARESSDGKASDGSAPETGDSGKPEA